MQVLTFENFKNRGLVCLSHSNTEHLLDLLEDAQATLALMLTSRHIGPLRDEAAAWAIKLKEISEVLEQVRERNFLRLLIGTINRTQQLVVIYCFFSALQSLVRLRKRQIIIIYV